MDREEKRRVSSQPGDGANGVDYRYHTLSLGSGGGGVDEQTLRSRPRIIR